MYLEGNRRWVPRTEFKTINWARRDTAHSDSEFDYPPPPPFRATITRTIMFFLLMKWFIKPCTVFKSFLCELENASSVGQC